MTHEQTPDREQDLAWMEDQARKWAEMIMEAPTDLMGGAINVWLARDLARTTLRLLDEYEATRS